MDNPRRVCDPFLSVSSSPRRREEHLSAWLTPFSRSADTGEIPEFTDLRGRVST